MAKIRHIRTGRDLYEATPVGGSAVQFKDIFNVADLITEMREWVVENLNAPPIDSDFPEVFYHHRFNQNGLEEMRSWWRIRDKINSFITYHYDIDVRVLALTKKEVIYKGMKFKTNHSDCEVRIFGLVEMAKGKWDKNFITKSFYELFRKRVYHQQIEYHRKMVLENTQRFINYLKNFFKLNTFMPEEEGQKMYTNREFE